MIIALLAVICILAITIILVFLWVRGLAKYEDELDKESDDFREYNENNKST